MDCNKQAVNFNRDKGKLKENKNTQSKQEKLNEKETDKYLIVSRTWNF